MAYVVKFTSFGKRNTTNIIFKDKTKAMAYADDLNYYNRGKNARIKKV